jgi:hypothetical protein
MSHPLDGVRAKLARADEHIKQINDDIILHRKIRIPADSVRGNLQFEAAKLNDPSTHRKRIVFFLKGQPPPVDLGLTIRAGEAVHHLRSVLDHLVYQLVLANTKQPPTFNSAFPIIGRGRMRKKAWVDAPALYADQVSALRLVISTDAETRIGKLQPFQRGSSYNEDPLWVLSELDNAYKHRLLLLQVHRVTNFSTTVRSNGVTITRDFKPKIRFEDGAEIGRVEITEPAFSIADKDVTVENDLVVQIAFDEIAGKRDVPIFDCLGDTRVHVRRIVDDFATLPEFV